MLRRGRDPFPSPGSYFFLFFCDRLSMLMYWINCILTFWDLLLIYNASAFFLCFLMLAIQLNE